MKKRSRKYLETLQREVRGKKSTITGDTLSIMVNGGIQMTIRPVEKSYYEYSLISEVEVKVFNLSTGCKMQDIRIDTEKTDLPIQTSKTEEPFSNSAKSTEIEDEVNPLDIPNTIKELQDLVKYFG